MRHWDCGNVEVRVIATELVAASLGNEAATQEEDIRRRIGTSGLWTSLQACEAYEVYLHTEAATLGCIPNVQGLVEGIQEGDSEVPEEAYAVLGPQVTQPRG